MDTRHAVVVAALILALATGRQLQDISRTTVFAGNEQQRQHPLAVLRADTADDRRAPSPPELKIFAEDPNWASKVRCTRVVRQYQVHRAYICTFGVVDVLLLWYRPWLTSF